MNYNEIIFYINIIIGLIGLFIGIWIIGRLKGKLKISVMFILGASIIFILKEILKIFSIFTSANLEFIRSIANTMIILFVVFSGLVMKQLINNIHKPSKKRGKNKFKWFTNIKSNYKKRKTRINKNIRQPINQIDKKGINKKRFFFNKGYLVIKK